MKKRQQKKQPAMSRRDFMKSIGRVGVALGPMQLLMDGLVDGLVNKAHAQAVNSGLPVRNYVYLHLGGGMTRWYWDQPLVPYESNTSIIQPDARTAHVFTRFTDRGGFYDNPIYATRAITRNGVTLNMPHLWGSNIPTSNGGVVPMESLLDNMLMMRSFDGLIDFHAEASSMQIRPSGSAPSLDGLVADRSTKSLPAVSFGGANNFRSGMGGGIATCTGGDPLNQLLAPFARSGDYNPFLPNTAVNDGLSATFMSRRDAIDSALKGALTQLGIIAKSRYPGSEALFSVRNSAEPLIKQGITNLLPVYQQLLAKYRGLIARCATTAMPGITDKPVSTANIAPQTNNEARYNGFRVQLRIPDIMEVRNANLATMIQASTMIDEVAESFAVAEFLIVNGYSSSARMSLGETKSLLVQNSVDFDSGQIVSRNGYWNGDAHGGGAWTGLIINSFIFTALSACLYEMISQLKSKNLFDETVFQISSDFGRNPGSDGSTGHESRNSNTTLISGAIKKPMVVGNCLNNGGNGFGNWGGWGLAAPVTIDGASTTLGIGHISSTVSHLLRVEKINPNNSSLVLETATSGIVNNVELAKNRS